MVIVHAFQNRELNNKSAGLLPLLFTVSDRFVFHECWCALLRTQLGGTCPLDCSLFSFLLGSALFKQFARFFANVIRRLKQIYILSPTTNFYVWLLFIRPLN